MATIQVIQGPDKGLRFDLLDDENVIGRKGSSVHLSDETISRRHARLVPKDSQWILEDLGSANGTFINGTRLSKPTAVHRGDQIRCGSTLFVFGGLEGVGKPVVRIDEDEQLIDAAIVATVPSNDDSVIIPTPEAGAQAIGNLRILYGLIAETSSIFNVDVLMSRTLEKISRIVKADRGYIMLIDGDGKLTVKASRLADEQSDRSTPISRTIINEVLSKQVGVLSSNAMSDKRFTSGKSVHNLGIRSTICVPIRGRDRILGVIQVDCNVSDQTYSTEQLRLLTAIGSQTGLALENVALYESAVQQERLAAVGETVAFLSHHVKNILQALGAGTDLVESAIHNGELAKATEAWPIVQRNLAKINDLILNMLAFSKSRQPLLETVNVNEILNECVDLLNAHADQHKIALIAQLDDLPPIPADSAGLHQAFMNLLGNAMDAVSDETGAVTITSEYNSMNRQVLVRISDNGTGIPEDQLEKLFTPFFSTKGQKGTGLGLAVAKKVFQEHHGSIKVTSRVNEGTTFLIALPAVQADSNETGYPVAN